MTEAQAILLAVKCGIQVVVSSRPDSKKNTINVDALMKLIQEIKNG